MALNEEVENATTLKRWDDWNIAFKLESVLDDLDKNRVPKDHVYYIKIKNLRQDLLTSLENIKTKAAPKIAAYSNSVDLANYPNINADIERAETLAQMYQNTRVEHLEDPDKARLLFGQLAQVPDFIAESRKQYAPLVEHQIALGRSIDVKLKWLEKNYAQFLQTKESFVSLVPAAFEQSLGRAKQMSDMAVSKRNPLLFTGGVSQSLEQAENLLRSYAHAQGSNDTQYKMMLAKMEQAKQDAKQTEKALESEIIASTKAPEEAFTGSGGSGFIKQMITAWNNNNPSDEIMDIRIAAKDWVREVGYEWNGGYSRWEKYDRQWLKMAVIVKTNSEIATIYPAFINRDNMKQRETLVASHDSTYVIRKMLVKNVF